MRFVIPCLVFLVFGCHSGTSSTPSETPIRASTKDNAVQPATTVEASIARLHFDETLQHNTLQLRLLALSDSRCPRGAECVWEGQVVATVEASRKDQPAQQVELILRAGNEPAPQVGAGYEFRLLDVQPYPHEGITVERGEYTATLEIRP